jgi:hypothetical protein
LKKRKEETGPAEQSRSFHCAGSNRFGDNVARRDSMNRSGQRGRAYSAKRNPALIPLIPSFYANSGKSPDPLGLLAPTNGLRINENFERTAATLSCCQIYSGVSTVVPCWRRIEMSLYCLLLQS